MPVHPRRLRLPLVAGVALVLIATRTGALPPPIYTHDQQVHHFRQSVEVHARCPDLTEEPGVFGNVEVRFTAGRKFTIHTSKALGKRFTDCVRRAVVEVGEFPMPTAADRRDGEKETTILLWFGKPVANMIEPARLLPAWQKAAREPGALRAILPPDVAVTKNGCLLPDGEWIRAGVDAWLDKWTRPVPSKWWSFFHPLQAPRFVDQKWFIAQDKTRAYCLHALDDARERAIRPRFDQEGACWQGKLADLLVAPRAAFPADRRYRSVSVAGDRACAVDTAGAIVCCGSPVPQPPPQGSFKAVSVAGTRACAIRSDDTIACWSGPEAPPIAPFDGRYAEVVVGDGTACARRFDGRFDCRGRPLAPAPASSAPLDIGREDVRQLRIGPGGFCLLRRNGSLACSGHDEPTPPPKDVAAVDRDELTCVLLAGGEVLCPLNGRDGPWGNVTRDRFKDIAVTSWGGCGRRPDDTIGCWGRVPAVVPRGRFRSIESGAGHVCGIRDDGRVVCWGDRSGVFWTDVE